MRPIESTVPVASMNLEETVQLISSGFGDQDCFRDGHIVGRTPKHAEDAFHFVVERADGARHLVAFHGIRRPDALATQVDLLWINTSIEETASGTPFVSESIRLESLSPANFVWVGNSPFVNSLHPPGGWSLLEGRSLCSTRVDCGERLRSAMDVIEGTTPFSTFTVEPGEPTTIDGVLFYNATVNTFSFRGSSCTNSFPFSSTVGVVRDSSVEPDAGL